MAHGVYICNIRLRAKNKKYHAVADLGTGATGARPPFGRIRKFFKYGIDYASIMMQLLIFSPPFSIPSLILINLYDHKNFTAF